MAVSQRARFTWLVATAALCVARRAPAQDDSLSSVFRRTVTAVEVASSLSPLRSTALGAGMRREIRIFVGFGFGVPHQMLRLWEDDGGAHGRFGLFWPLAERLANQSADDSVWRQFDARIVAFVDSTYACRDVRKAEWTAVCWLPPSVTDDWVGWLRSLDAAGVDTIPREGSRQPTRDGWGIVVEVRDQVKFRVYDYQTPSEAAVDPGTRAASQVAEVFRRAWRTRFP